MNNTVAYVYLSLAMLIAGSAVVAGKIMVERMPVFLAAELGLLVSLLVLLPLTFWVRRECLIRNIQTNLLLLAQALCGVVLYRLFFFWGLNHTTAVAGGLISSAAPVIIALLAVVLLGEAWSVRRMGGALCVAAGLVAVNAYPFIVGGGSGQQSVQGNALIFAAVLSEAAFSVMSKARCQSMSATYRTCMLAVFAFVCLLPFALYDAMFYDLRQMDSLTAACLVYYGVFVSFLSYVFWFRGIALVPAGTAASFTGLVPLGSFLLSWWLLREPVHSVHFVGLAGVLGGIGLSCMPVRSKKTLVPTDTTVVESEPV